MALWGNADSKTATGGAAVAANGLVTGTATLFDTEAQVGDYLVVNSTVSFVISSITSNVAAHVVAAVPGTSVNVVANGAYSFSEKPKYVSFAESADSAGRSGDPSKVYGVDTTEAGVTAGASAGWVRRTAGTGGRAGRTQYEVLVAGRSITGDAADDTEFPDS